MDERTKSLDFAKHWHGEQKRKYTGEPYWTHPQAVARLVATVAHTPEMIDAAHLHDVLEDTLCPEDLIYTEFGAEVLALVKMLSKVSKPEDGNREVRKTLDRAHYAMGSANAKTIKIADLIHNAYGILEHDPHFAKIFIPEMDQLLVVMSAGNQILWQRANSIVLSYKYGNLTNAK
jgi:(p)ppGpp synthase/HD superfamily hydrolase